MEILAFLLCAAVVGFVLLPLLRGRAAPLEGGRDISEEESRKRVALRALRDAEYDRLSGKLDDEDYLRLREQLQHEALTALEEVESREGGAAGTRPESDADAVEEDIRRLREALREGTLCRRCGRENPSESRFCGGCGGALAGGADDAERRGRSEKA